MNEWKNKIMGEYKNKKINKPNSKQSYECTGEWKNGWING